jgi:DNA cross-link repair 1C protein
VIEGNGKAVLYTGDIRSEPWWVNSFARNPSLVQYASGLKTLDRIYLDTSMLNDDIIQTKAEGLTELLDKVSQYPDDTVFCMQAWTYGYEEVWITLSNALNSKVSLLNGNPI